MRYVACSSQESLAHKAAATTRLEIGSVEALRWRRGGMGGGEGGVIHVHCLNFKISDVNILRQFLCCTQMSCCIVTLFVITLAIGFSHHCILACCHNPIPHCITYLFITLHLPLTPILAFSFPWLLSSDILFTNRIGFLPTGLITTFSSPLFTSPRFQGMNLKWWTWSESPKLVCKGAFFWDYFVYSNSGIDSTCVLLGAIPIPEWTEYYSVHSAPDSRMDGIVFWRENCASAPVFGIARDLFY